MSVGLILTDIRLEMMKKKFACSICAIGLLCAVVALLLLPLYIVGTDADLYHRLQLREGILPEAGISEAELRDVDRALAAYLAGDREALSSVPFNETEMRHMADCYDLFVLLRRALWVCGIAGAALTAIGIAAGARRPDRILLICASACALALIALAVWGCIDFASLFTCFHKLLFTNDLWLLDPATDLLIHICPEGMFASMAVRIGGLWLGSMAILYTIFRMFIRRRTNA